MALVLYPKVTVKVRDFSKVKKQVVPNQSMSLKEIVTRFIRRESLPVSKEGIYEERFGDLEKLTKADVTIKEDRIEELKAQLKESKLRIKAKEEEAKKKAEEAKVEEDKKTLERLKGLYPELGNTAQKSTPTGA